MATYLFTWNPKRWEWVDIQDCIKQVEENGYFSDRWSSGVTKKIMPGDRAFLMKLGDNNRGIFASGWIKSKVFESKHWDNEKREKGKTAFYVYVDWDTLLNPEEKIFPRELLNTDLYSKMHWEPQASGTLIPEDVAEQLEKDWAEFLDRPLIISDLSYPDEIETKSFLEGTARQVTVNVYERNPEARTICINHYGLNCFICGFNFKSTYGNVGGGFIHVHHLKPISEIRKGYELNPIKDLRPVCPNCHAMLHRRKPAYSIEELKAFIKT